MSSVFEHFEKLSTLGNFALFIGLFLLLTGIYLIFQHVVKKGIYLIGAGFFIIAAIIIVFFYFHQTKEIPYTSSKDIADLGDDLKCYYGSNECTFNTDTRKIECGYWRGSESNALTCKYKSLQKTFPVSDKNTSISIDDMFLVVDDIKVSFKNDQLIAKFGFKNPITNLMVPLEGHDEINVSICEKPCKAKINVDSTYTVKSKRSEIETVFKKNCDDKISVRQNISGCESLKEFDISVPFDNKHVYMKDNRYIFIGDVKQSSLPLYTNKQFFDTTIKIDFIEPKACFVLGLGENTLKIENRIVSLNGERVSIPKLEKNEPVYLQIQKNYSSINILVSQESTLGEAIKVDYRPEGKKKITFGYTLESKLMKDVLGVYVSGVETIREE